ncbi:hypothetical protein GI582_18020 [Sulfitobacter sp. BDSS02]|nr:hypothetical protein [Sulfitobacter sp. BDSS02]MBR9850924.1 hypothetical protein [Paracoccaceae bacterium]
MRSRESAAFPQLQKIKKPTVSDSLAGDCRRGNSSADSKIFDTGYQVSFRRDGSHMGTIIPIRQGTIVALC